MDPALAHASLAKSAHANACDKQGSPAILWAAGGGKTECLKLLIQAGADPNAKDRDGTTPPALANRENSREMLDIFLAASARDGGS